MKKYLLTLKLGFSDLFASRLQLALWIAVAMIPSFITLGVFKSLGKKVDQDHITLYFLTVNIVKIFTFLSIDSVISEDIFGGTLSLHLVKPYSYIKAVTCRYLSTPIVKLLLCTPYLVIVLIVFLSKDYIPSVTYLLLFLLSILGGLSITLAISFIVGLATFWFQRVWFLRDLVLAVTIVLSGASVPLYIFPASLIPVIKILPFRYLADFQMNLILDRSKPVLWEYVLFSFYIASLWIIVYFLFSKGIKKYEAFGN